MINLAKSLISN